MFGFIFNHPLASRHKTRAFFRFLLWQIQSSFTTKQFFSKHFIGNIRFYAKKRLTGITGNIYTGLHEFEDMMFLLHFLQPDDCFMDLGANVGAYTLLAAGITGAKSISVEPVLTTFDILYRNISLNKLEDKIILINSGVSSENGMISFSTGDDTTNHVIASDELTNTNSEEIEVITVDSLLIYGSPALIKIDVEGYETEVLKGMQQTLSNPLLKCIIIELMGNGVRYGFDEYEIHKAIIERGFVCCTYDPFSRALSETKQTHSSNSIYCRDINFIKNRIQQAPRINIMGESL